MTKSNKKGSVAGSKRPRTTKAAFSVMKHPEGFTYWSFKGPIEELMVKEHIRDDTGRLMQIKAWCRLCTNKPFNVNLVIGKGNGVFKAHVESKQPAEA